MMIFISYTKEDHEFACELYLALKRCGQDLWIDKPPAPYDLDGLQPGQRWRDEINRRVRSADLMILLLSPISVQKVGYVQREFRLALHVMNDTRIAVVRA